MAKLQSAGSQKVSQWCLLYVFPASKIHVSTSTRDLVMYDQDVQVVLRGVINIKVQPSDHEKQWFVTIFSRGINVAVFQGKGEM